MMGLFDSHCHLDDSRFDDDLQDVIDRMQVQGMMACTCVGSDLETSKKCIDIARQHDLVYAAAGVHPHEAKDVPDDYLNQIEALLQHEKVVALGEIGLDYYYDHSPRETQKKVFLEQLELAYALQKPVILHVRDAHGDVLDLLKERKNRLPGGIVHCYSGSADSAREYMDLGFYISFAGPVTYKNARKPNEAATYVPLDRLLIETDSPYLAPVPLRGKRNEPANVRYVCEHLAGLQGVSSEEMAQVTCRNACTVYGIQL